MFCQMGQKHGVGTCDEKQNNMINTKINKVVKENVDYKSNIVLN